MVLCLIDEVMWLLKQICVTKILQVIRLIDLRESGINVFNNIAFNCS